MIKLKPGEYAYHPELQEERPNAEMKAWLAYDCKHYFIDAPVKLAGQGIRFEKDYGAFKRHYVTIRAYKKLLESYSISKAIYLD